MTVFKTIQFCVLIPNVKRGDKVKVVLDSCNGLAELSCYAGAPTGMPRIWMPSQARGIAVPSQKCS